jgi:hypothetical protein
MPEKYFEKFPIIQYANNFAIDITKSAKILDTVYNNPYFYYQYNIEQGERPDNISDKVYSDEYGDWAVYLANKITDPYYHWYLDDFSFNSFIIKKYGSIRLSQLKYIFYRNNWYENTSPISLSTFNALTVSAKQYYEPDFGVDPLSTIVLQYKRRKIDWTLNTNSLVNYTVANGSSFSYDNLVSVDYTGGAKGSGQVIASNSTSVSLGFVDNIQSISTGSLFNKETGSNTTFTSQIYIANNIPADEASFWSPVTYFDYETEINEQNKSIRLLNSQYYSPMAQNLKTILI